MVIEGEKGGRAYTKLHSGNDCKLRRDRRGTSAIFCKTSNRNSLKIKEVVSWCEIYIWLFCEETPFPALGLSEFIDRESHYKC